MADHDQRNPYALEQSRVRRTRAIGFVGAGVSFLASQLSLLWVLASGGIGSSPSIAASAWLVSTLATALCLVVVSNSYRSQPRLIDTSVVRMPSDALESRD